MVLKEWYFSLHLTLSLDFMLLGEFSCSISTQSDIRNALFFLSLSDCKAIACSGHGLSLYLVAPLPREVTLVVRHSESEFRAVLCLSVCHLSNDTPQR